MTLLLKAADGSVREFATEEIPKDTEIILLRSGVMLKPADMDAISRILTKRIGKETIVLPAWVKDVTVLRE